MNITYTQTDKYILELFNSNIITEFIDTPNTENIVCYDNFYNMTNTKHNFITIDKHVNCLQNFTILKTSTNINWQDLCNPFNVEKVVFSGGGSRGIIYIGSILGLYKLHTLFYLNTFIGTSAGALTSLILSCITPSKEIYNNTKNNSINDNIKTDIFIDAIKFCVNRLWKRNLSSFYATPSYSFFGLLGSISSLLKDNSLYDNEKSGFNIWIAFICKNICKIMGNKLDEKIIIKKDGNIIDNLTPELIDTENFHTNYVLERFFTFQEYHDLTNKTLIITGTNTKNTNTQYYTHTDNNYKDLNVIVATIASMSIPWVFKAPIINNYYHFDGGLYDNYPITLMDIKDDDKIIKYDNTIFGFLIDNKDKIINICDVITELWIIYNGFSKITQIDNLQDSNEFVKLSELFFEIKTELSNLLFAPKEILRQYLDGESDYNINNLFINETQHKIIINNLLVKLTEYNTKNIDDMFECSINHGNTCSELYKFLTNNNINIENKNFLINNILIFYDLKYKLINNKHNMNINNILEKIKLLLDKFSEIYSQELAKLTEPNKNINNIISMLRNFVISIIGNDINIAKTQTHTYSYQNLINYFYNTSMNDILCKYFNIVNNKLCNDNFNVMRTIVLDTYDSSILDFNMNDEIKIKLICQGYTKTIQHFSNILHLMKITGKTKNEKYIKSYETLYKELFV